MSSVARPNDPIPRRGTAVPVREWRAVGDASRDLSGWVADAVACGAAVSVVARDCERCTGEELQRIAEGAYAEALGKLPCASARLWTFLPRPTEAAGSGLDRYMHLNIGRARAYAKVGAAGAAMPAGTCVGHTSDQLVIYALSAAGPVTSVENPRQMPAWNYSATYGPVAPPFSRGVLVGNELWASGTASVVGEESRHAGDIHAQWQETLANLEALRACAAAPGRWSCMRAYVRDEHDLQTVADLGCAAFEGGLVEVLHAPLCRGELLVEVEGVARE